MWWAKVLEEELIIIIFLYGEIYIPSLDSSSR